jgi:acetyl esterase/lipase
VFGALSTSAGDGTFRRIERVRRYGHEHRSQVGELFGPEGGAEAPVAVVLHGGFWKRRYDRHLNDALCRDLAARGWAAWNVEYRRVGFRGGGGWPATFSDVAAAVDHLAVLDRELPLDLGRVVAIGHSAGGHLALWAAARTGLPGGAPGAGPIVSVTHAVAQAGVSDLAEAARLELGGGAAGRLLGGTPVERPELYALGSPRARLPLGVPQLLVHGEKDDTVPVRLSRWYAEAAAAAEDEVELVTLPGVGHFEHLDPGSGAWKIVTDWLP